MYGGGACVVAVVVFTKIYQLMSSHNRSMFSYVMKPLADTCLSLLYFVSYIIAISILSSNSAE